MNNSLKKDREIAGSLPRAWPAFFERYGRLTCVQREVIPEILKGNDLLVCSATASGKTEAICAPLIEKNIDIMEPWTILYISPTRALVNDLYERLRKPINGLGLSILRRTGDYASRLSDISNILITTPESFDSMMCRGRLRDSVHGHILSMVNTVVLDEIHLLYGSSRGEQIRWLIARLRRLKNQAYKQGWCNNDKIQILGLSATVADADAVVEKFMVDGKAILVPGDREIEKVNKDNGPVEKSLPNYLTKLKKAEKILVFCDARKRVDKLAYNLKKVTNDLGYKVVAHHGSLSKKIREEAENIVKNEDRVIAVATSTLEIGIDIGNIDLIVLDGPPPDIAAFLQRIGRGNRRTDKTRVMLCSNNKSQALVQETMLNAAASGHIGATNIGFNYSVVFQQIASYIFQSRRRSRSRKQIRSLVDLFFEDKDSKAIIGNMIQNGEIIEDKSGLRLGEYWLDMTRTGIIHSNIDSPVGYNIIDEITGDKIASDIKDSEGMGLKTGGNLFQKSSYDDHNIEVKRVKNEKSAEGEWSYVGKKRFRGPDQANSIRQYLNIDNDIWPIVGFKGKTYVFHLGGTARQIIMEALSNINDNSLFINQYYLILDNIIPNKPDWVKHCDLLGLETYLHDRIDWFENKLCRPSKNVNLPINLRIKEAKKWLDYDKEIDAIQKSSWVTKIKSEVTESLKLFC